jgi:hypothetical protein
MISQNPTSVGLGLLVQRLQIAGIISFTGVSWRARLRWATTSEIKGGIMAKRSNYSFQKRQKEIKKQEKKEQKLEKKRMKKEAAAGDDQGEGVEEVNEDLVAAGIAPDDN